MLLLIFISAVGVGAAALLNLMSWPPYYEALLGGVAIMAAGYVLSVAVEAAQKDVSRALATIILALLAVLPEYAVDIYLAYMGGSHPHYVHYATANMTGANRMLLGLFWPIVGFVGLYLGRGRKTVRGKAIILDRSFRLEVFFLLLATLYSFKLPLFGRITIFDSLVLVSIFGAYAWIASSSHLREEEFEGVVESIVHLRKPLRITIVSFLFLMAGAVIFLSVERFTEGLIRTGELFGISEFLLIQWVAPVASEMPELVVAVLLALKGKTTTAIGALVSSKVNQWTLLVGALPLAYSLGSGRLTSMPLDPLQREELFLTAAQSLFGSILIADLKLSRGDALLLFTLFWLQWLIPIPSVRMVVGVIYIVLSVVLIFKDRGRMISLLRYARDLL
ncbi:MAG: sodium:calcium antiporter [Thermotogae bacterium]|nr:sodium:calcium antiporter [Thermotogota bacterium]